jgi:hypothetical protein
MNSRERLAAALLGHPVDHVPFAPFLAYVWESFPQEVRQAGPLAFHHAIGADPLWRGAPCPVKSVPPPELAVRTWREDNLECTAFETPVGVLRQATMNSPSGNTSFLVEHPVKTGDDFKIWQWVEERTSFAYDDEPVRRHFAGEGREGLSIGMLLPRMKSAYQTLVEHLVGTEELVYALCDCPETVEELWLAMVANDLEAAELALRSDYEWFLTLEDSSTQNYSPSQYDRFIGSEIAQWCELLRSAGKRYIQHACGHVAALVERMRDTGVSAIESLSPPPTGNVTLAEARRLGGPSFGIIGGIEPVTFLQSTEAELEAYVGDVLRDGAGGPFILANSDSCPPGVTIGKFRLVADLVKA